VQQVVQDRKEALEQLVQVPLEQLVL